MDARFSRPMEAWSRCSPAEKVTTDSCGISSQWVDKILFYSDLHGQFAEGRTKIGFAQALNSLELKK